MLTPCSDLQYRRTPVAHSLYITPPATEIAYATSVNANHAGSKGAFGFSNGVNT